MPAFNNRVRPNTILGIPEESFFLFAVAFILFMVTNGIKASVPFFFTVIIIIAGLFLILAGIWTLLNKNKLLLRRSVVSSKSDEQTLSRWQKARE